MEENKSNILTEEQINTIVNKEEVKQEEVILPSEEANIELPEKYAGKSAEEVYKLMQVEAEYKANKENNVEETTETPKPEDVVNNETEPTRLELINEFTEKVKENGGEFSEEIYKQLEAKGISKEEADVYKAGIEANQAKEIAKTFEAAETTQEDFAKAGEWARENWPENRIAEFNDSMDAAFKSGNVNLQKTLIRSLMESSKIEAPKQVDTIHTNQVQNLNTKEVYRTKSDYFRDSQDSRMKTDSSYRALVERKYLATDKSNW